MVADGSNIVNLELRSWSFTGMNTIVRKKVYYSTDTSAILTFLGAVGDEYSGTIDEFAPRIILSGLRAPSQAAPWDMLADTYEK